MHHYSTSTCAQLPDGHKLRARQLWAVDIPQRGFKCELVLNAILAIAAQHLWALTPNEPSLAVASRSYFDKAIRLHRMELAQPDQSTAESLLAAAILLTHHTWVASHSIAPDEQYVLPLQTYHMARGIQSLFDQMFPWLKGSGYLWYAEQQTLVDVSDEVCGNEFLESGRKDLDLLSEAFEQSGAKEEDKALYRATVSELASMHFSISSGVPQHWIQRRVATMPLRLPPRFLELLESHDPIALALLLRNLALLEVIDPVWWLHGTGDHQVAKYSVRGIEELISTDWRWAIEWPRKVIEGVQFSNDSLGIPRVRSEYLRFSQRTGEPASPIGNSGSSARFPKSLIF